MFSTNKTNTLILISTLIFIFFSLSLQAQDTALEASIDAEFVVLEEEEILIPSLVEKNLFYVDLEKLEGGLSDLQLFNEEQEVILNSSLKEMPSDALYELDLSQMEKGKYLLRIRTYQNEVKKGIIVE
ncbi:MAG: hypothetical protein ACI94Y_004161 [Maribacter sp.]|jgi:hypothetical protein